MNASVADNGMAIEVSRPSALLALTELPRAMFELGSLPWATGALASAPRGDGHPVLVLPGFMAGDTSTAVLRRYLKRLGYNAYAWELGRNLGPKTVGEDGQHLTARIQEIYEETGQKVSMVGWSLGGVLARIAARIEPKKVRQVISLGSPFAGNPKSSNVWRVYEMMTKHKIDDESTRKKLAESKLPPIVPATAIFTKGDGIVAWETCMESESEITDNIQVYGSHCGLGVNSAVLYAVADRLALPDGEWKPFERNGLRRLVYPSAGHH